MYSSTILCTCSPTCANGSPCASGSAVLKTGPTGLKQVRGELTADVEMTGTVNANEVAVNFPEDPTYTFTSTGTFRVTLSIDAKRLSANSLAAGPFANAQINVHYGRRADGWQPPNLTGIPSDIPPVDTSAPYGSIDFDADASGQMFNAGEGELTDGPTAMILTGTDITAQVNVAFDSATNVATLTASISAQWSFALPVPGWVEPGYKPQYAMFAMVAGATLTQTVTVTPTSVCSATAANGSGGTSSGEGSIGIFGYQTGEGNPSEGSAVPHDDDATTYTGGPSISGTITAQDLTEDPAAADDPLTAKGCARAVDVAATLFDHPATTGNTPNPDTGGMDAIYAQRNGTLAARVVMPSVARCGFFTPVWTGFGTYNVAGVAGYNDDPDNSAFAVTNETPAQDDAVRVSLTDVQIGPLGTLAVLRIFRSKTTIGFEWASGGTSVNPTGGSFTVNTGGHDVTIAWGASAADVQTALEAVIPTGSIVRVRKLTDHYGGTSTGNTRYEITYAGPWTGLGSEVGALSLTLTANNLTPTSPHRPAINITSTPTGADVSSSQIQAIGLQLSNRCPSGAATLVAFYSDAGGPASYRVGAGESVSFTAPSASAIGTVTGDPSYFGE